MTDDGSVWRGRKMRNDTKSFGQALEAETAQSGRLETEAIIIFLLSAVLVLATLWLATEVL
jgi:hypothetical protein